MTREAELELEIARLREALILMLHEAESYGQAWARAYVREYQELLPGSAKEQFDLLAIMHKRLDAVSKAVLAPPSTTALQELITEVERRTIERCAKTCQGLFDMDDDSCNEAETCAEAIRALPTGNLKLEDLYMTYYLVLMNRENVVAVYSYDNEKAQLSMFDTLNRREYYARANPFYTHVQVHNEVD